MDSDIVKIVVFIVSCVVAIVGGIAGVTMISVFKKRMERGGEPRFPATELDTIHARLEATEALEGRVAELEERLDFAERLLAEHHEPESLPTGRALDSQH
jgi:hypothetical protein